MESKSLVPHTPVPPFSLRIRYVGEYDVEIERVDDERDNCGDSAGDFSVLITLVQCQKLGLSPSPVMGIVVALCRLYSVSLPV